MAHVLIFGDSITEGYWDSQGGWADRLKQWSYRRDLSANNIGSGHSIINLGISANTTTEILARIESDSIVRKVDRGDAVFVLAIGINDSRAEDEPTNYRFEINEFQSNMTKIIEIIKRWTNDIILVGLTPVDESLASPIYGNIFYNNERISEFNSVIGKLAVNNDLKYVDIFEAMSKLDYKSMMSDGLHPNDAGHEWIAEQVKPHLMKMLGK